MRGILGFILLLLLAPQAHGRVRIVTSDEVLRDWARLQVVDARSRGEFSVSHLPGAIHLDWRDLLAHKLSLSERLFGPQQGRVLADAKAIEELLTTQGLREDFPVLVYGGKSRWGEEGRIAWNLLYWGVQEVWLLDGGFARWREVTAPLPAKVIPRKRFVVSFKNERRADYQSIRSAAQVRKVIYDVRTSAERADGQIPNTTLFPDNLLYNSDGTYPSRETLERRFKEVRQVEFTYCAGGVRAALAALLFEARFGNVVKNYDGSMWDWIRHGTHSKPRVP